MSDSSECERTKPPKLRVSESTVPLVPRNHILSIVDDYVSSTPVTVVTGPAGCGKTTLLAEWARRRADAQGRRVAWLTLDQHDSTPERLRIAVRDALTFTGVWPDQRHLDAIPLSEPGFSSALVAAFDHAPVSVCLVLDNVHEVHDPEALASVDLLARQPPDRLRLVLLGRFPPPLHLARLQLATRTTADAPLSRIVSARGISGATIPASPPPRRHGRPRPR